MSTIAILQLVDGPRARFGLLALTILFLTFSGQMAQAQTFRLQLLHASDLEGSVTAIPDAPRFAALVDTLTRVEPHTILLSAGDNYIPGPFFNAAADLAVRDSLTKVYKALYGDTAVTAITPGNGRIDIALMNAIGFDASAVGNHEWDAGATLVGELLRQGANRSWTGAQFPYLSANLDYSAEAALRTTFRAGAPLATTFRSRPGDASKAALAASTIIVRGTERIGVVGATTPLLETISSPFPVRVKQPGAGTNDMAALATILQPHIDTLIGQGVNKVILVSHLQQISLEQALAPLLRGVDIIVAGGSSAVLANAGQRLRPGDQAFGPYPIVTQGADGDPTLIVSSGDEYQYLGRMVVDFDAQGRVIPTSVTPESGSLVTDSIMVAMMYGGDLARAYRPGSKADLARTLTEAVSGVVRIKDGRLTGRTNVFLEGRRTAVRRQETNLGNLTAEANLWYARRYDPTVQLSIKNGGGIRSEIGTVTEATPGTFVTSPPLANPVVGKQTGDVSSLDIENALRFDNKLSIVTVNAATVRRLVETAVSGWTATATPGAFPQIAGMRFSFDPALPARGRVRTLAVVDSMGRAIDTLVLNGQLRGDTARTYRMVTLNFLASGGDGYPFGTATGRRDLDTTAPLPGGQFPFFINGGEQDALAEYLLARYPSTRPFDQAETEPAVDTRIQILSVRDDQVLTVRRIGRQAGTLRLSPNPARATEARLTGLPSARSIEVRIHDLSGRVVARTQSGMEGQVALPLHGLIPGVYTVQAGGQSIRFVIE